MKGQVVELFNERTGDALAVQPDRTVLYRTVYTEGWKRTGKRVKEQVGVERFIANRLSEGWRPYRKGDVPSFSTLERWGADGIAEATDGCRVEPDGVCEHGCKSWLLVCGLI